MEFINVFYITNTKTTSAIILTGKYHTTGIYHSSFLLLFLIIKRMCSLIRQWFSLGDICFQVFKAGQNGSVYPICTPADHMTNADQSEAWTCSIKISYKLEVDK